MTLNKICRACLIAKESFQYFLFDNVSPNLFSFCTSIEVYQNETLPKTICENCYDLLTKFFNFKQECIKSQNTLLECKNIVKSENDAITKLIDLDIGIQSSDDDYVNEVELENIKIEENNVDQYENDDFKDIGSSITEKDQLPCVNKNKQTICVVLEKLTLPKNLIAKSISKINLSTFKKRKCFSCKLCKKIFSYPERYEAHKLEHEGKKVSIACMICNKTFSTWSGLRRHKESEHTSDTLDHLRCAMCYKTFKTRHTLRMHYKTHGERTPCVCDVCGKKFTSKNGLQKHLETHKENRERKYECKQCGKKFLTTSTLQSHQSKFHRGKKYVCNICNHPFSEKCNLVRHVHLHEGLKSFKCDLCEKSYATKASLIEHKRIHSGERPFTCVYCPKSFPAKKRLDEHHRTHTGKKPYKCGVCSQGFTQRGTLKRHMKVHDKFSTTHT